MCQSVSLSVCLSVCLVFRFTVVQQSLSKPFLVQLIFSSEIQSKWRGILWTWACCWTSFCPRLSTLSQCPLPKQLCTFSDSAIECQNQITFYLCEWYIFALELCMWCCACVLCVTPAATHPEWQHCTDFQSVRVMYLSPGAVFVLCMRVAAWRRYPAKIRSRVSWRSIAFWAYLDSTLLLGIVRQHYLPPCEI